MTASPPVAAPAPPITLLTDFGSTDFFVGAMKGVILSIHPGAQLVDLTHEIAPQDVQAGAFTLLSAYDVFPAGSVHVAVIDPGVGSARRPIVVAAGGYRFVGPDNGLFSYVLDREVDTRVFHLTEQQFFRPVVSSTFHGRDIFAPVAAALSLGVAPEAMGVEIHDPVRFDPFRARRLGSGAVEGAVLHVDRFGNCITSLTRADLPLDSAEGDLRLEAGSRIIPTLRRFFADGEDGQPFAIWGSAGFLEIAVRCGSAADDLGLRRGDRIRLTL